MILEVDLNCWNSNLCMNVYVCGYTNNIQIQTRFLMEAMVRMVDNGMGSNGNGRERERERED